MFTALKLTEKTLPLLVDTGDLDYITLERLLKKYKTGYYLVINDEKTEISWLPEHLFKEEWAYARGHSEDQFSEVVRL